jgi:hypothetical protein
MKNIVSFFALAMIMSCAAGNKTSQQNEIIRKALLKSLMIEILKTSSPIRLGDPLIFSLNFRPDSFYAQIWKALKKCRPSKDIRFQKILYLEMYNSDFEPRLVNSYIVYYDSSDVAIQSFALDTQNQFFENKLAFDFLKNAKMVEIPSGYCKDYDCSGNEDVAYQIWLDSKYRFVECKVASPFPDSRIKEILSKGVIYKH